MSKLPRISSRECVNALAKAGFHVERQTGSHIIMIRENPYAQTVVPQRRELDTGTLRSIIRQAGMSVDEFKDLL